MSIYSKFRRQKSKSAGLFILIVVFSFLIHHIPILNYPFLWLAAIFKIIGMALGDNFGNYTLISADINWDSNINAVTNATDYKAQIIAKYLLSIAAGFTICFNAKRFKNKGDNFIPVIICLAILTVPLLYGTKFSTCFISFTWFVAVLLYIFWKYRSNYTKYIILAIGIFCIINGAYEPFLKYEILEFSDIHYLEASTGLFAYIWFIIFFIPALTALYYIWIRVVYRESYLDLFR